tara:strand:+ start:524 stop:1033 length:510 start_codon:yes stop_codon:yes gene_type:complete
MDIKHLTEIASELDRKPNKKKRKPEKTCPECNTANHARSSNCKSCNYEFYVRKNKKQELLAANWRQLKAGDIIKCVAGHGTYFLSKDRPLNPDGSRQRIMMGQKGKFEVSEIIDQGSRSCGIVGRQIYGRGHKANVREYIYMGESYYNDDLNLYYEPHKIKVIKTCQSM